MLPSVETDNRICALFPWNSFEDILSSFQPGGGTFQRCCCQSPMVLYTVMSFTWHYDLSINFTNEGVSAILS